MARFKHFRQLEQMDCGPACLKMVAAHYGKVLPLELLRRLCYQTREGVSILGISEAAEQLGFRTVGVSINLQQLVHQSPFPCIVHWNRNHFVVVYRATKRFIQVADPGIGLLKYTYADFEKGWLPLSSTDHHGLALLLEPGPAFEDSAPAEEPPKKTFEQFFRYFRRYRKHILYLFASLLVGSLIQLLFPLLTQSIVDSGIRKKDIPFIYLVLAGQLMLFAGKIAVEFFKRWILLFLSVRLNISIISEFLGKLLRLPLSFFTAKATGDLLQRVDDHTRIERFLSSSTLAAVFSFFNFIAFGIILATYNRTIFLVFASFSAAYFFYVFLFMKKRAKLDYQKFQGLAQNQGALLEMINGMAEIKLNNCETYKRWEWQDIQMKIFNVNVASMRLLQYQDGGGLLINELKNILITFLTAMAVIRGDMTFGMMLSVQYLIGQLNGPVNDFINFSRDYQDARLSFERINEIHSLPEEVTQSSSASILSTPYAKTIMLDNISFSYGGPHMPKVLDQLNLIIPEGKVTAIVGASGSGKTTLLKLLLRFFDPDEGLITVGNVDLRSLNPASWRKQCGVVLQDGYIFSDTIARNIALADKSIDYERADYAAELACIKEVIESLPNGLHTQIGNGGFGLSHGQKQRLLLARAIYKDPEFLFLDEATSALDANNERKIIGNLDRFFRGRTVIVVAHRLSTVKNADQIVVLDRGTITEAGTHRQLAESEGAYYHLVKNQLELGR